MTPPDKWPKVKLRDVCIPAERFDAPIPGQQYRQVGVRLWGHGAYKREAIDGANTKYKALNRVRKDDIIVNKIWARNGSVSVVSENLDGCYCSGEFPLFEPSEERLDPRWFYWITRTRWFWHCCDVQSRGTSGKNRIRPEKFLAIDIPLPPLSEQRRIVAKINRLAAKIEKAQGLRENSAVALQAFLMQGVVSCLRPKTDWVLSTIGDSSRMSTGTTPPSKREEYFGGNIQWYTPGDLGFAKLLTRSSRTITERAVIDGKARMFQPNTILLVVIGGSLGKVGIIRERSSSNQQITGIFFNRDVDTEYGFWWLRSRYHDLRGAAPAATLPILSQRRLGEMDFAYPRRDEQGWIVEYLNGLQAKVDQLKALQEKTATELDALLPSILDKAFKGEL